MEHAAGTRQLQTAVVGGHRSAQLARKSEHMIEEAHLVHVRLNEMAENQSAENQS